MTYNLNNKIFFQPDLSFNNHNTWKDFCDSSNWNVAANMFEERISDFFFDAIERLYNIDSAGSILKVHNFPISNICWSILDLLAQLEAGKRVKGIEVDEFSIKIFKILYRHTQRFKFSSKLFFHY